MTMGARLTIVVELLRHRGCVVNPAAPSGELPGFA
jgi:hypothetical protein